MMAASWNYRVVVCGGLADEKFSGAITAAGLTLASGHSSGSVAGPGGELPEVDTWAILLHADTAEEAERRVADALKGLDSPRFIDMVESFDS